MAVLTMTPNVPVATASGLLAMLQEPDPVLRSHALQRLLGCVDMLWHEVAEALPELEAIAEDENDPSQKTAAAVASRVFFYLDEPTQALRLALEAGEQHFDVVHDTSPYVESLVAAAIEAYIQSKQQEREKAQDAEEEEAAAALDPVKLHKVVQSMMERCYADFRYGHALGVAYEAREVGKVREILTAADERCTPAELETILDYALNTALSLVTSRSFRNNSLSIIAEFLEKQFFQGNAAGSIYRSAAVALCHCRQLLNDAPAVSSIISQLLLKGQEDDTLLGFQLCFDLTDSGDQAFVTKVAEGLEKATSNTSSSGEGAETKEPDDETARLIKQALNVLTGGFSSELALSFLHKNSDADPLIMANLKKTLEERGGGGRNSVLHNAAVATHAYLNAGTTNDAFLRNNLDWMRKASNWAKFSATASLGVLHSGHISEAMTLLEPYLPPSPTPQEGSDGAGVTPVTAGGGFAEGGSLYALGLIHGSYAGSSAAKRKETSEFLRNHLRASHANEVISHGAALGVGLTTFGTRDLTVVNELKELLYTDSAVAGEAAGIAIGMTLVGSGAGNAKNSMSGTGEDDELQEIISDLKNYARETQHEKIIRGIAMGLALVNYGQEENADAVIEEMRGDRDPILRYGAQYALALAYCGTGSNKAVRILLHTAVSDVSDDVRMAAVIGLAFVLYKTPERVPELVKLLLESFNPHVRYASCMAVGIAMAGSGSSESIALLEPMLEDMTDFVRQGALIGTAMIYMQQSDTCNGKKIKSFREKLTGIVSDKHQSTLTKMGAILSIGIIDAGGRNCSLGLGSRDGFTKMTSVIGLALWLQHWHWYPLMHMFSLALTPTLTMGLKKDFLYPKNFEIQCNAKPSVFAYPKRLEEKKEEKKKRVETVTLSTTAKNKARLARKRAKEEGTAMEVETGDAEGEKEAETETKKEEGVESMDIDETEGDEKKKKKREPELSVFRLGNPCRITTAQSKFCEFDLNQRYRPVRPEEKPFGVVMLTDCTPGEEEDLGEVKAPSVESEDEPEAPDSFEWTPPEHPDGATAGDAADTSAPAAADDKSSKEEKPSGEKPDKPDMEPENEEPQPQD